MPTPFLFYDLFETQCKLKAETIDLPGLGDIVVVEDFYRNPEAICDLLTNSALPPWKIAAGSRNVITHPLATGGSL